MLKLILWNMLGPVSQHLLGTKTKKLFYKHTVWHETRELFGGREEDRVSLPKGGPLTCLTDKSMIACPALESKGYIRKKREDALVSQPACKMLQKGRCSS